jgi:hypothetical protein
MICDIQSQGSGPFWSLEKRAGRDPGVMVILFVDLGTGNSVCSVCENSLYGILMCTFLYVHCTSIKVFVKYLC